mmetsp:Transcript_18940/g.34261  ORF Transcript_18940/g.34261 Transcript_18940/m.34261 type:complete len:96 (+) Transcript_18940:287-574(+)
MRGLEAGLQAYLIKESHELRFPCFHSTTRCKVRRRQTLLNGEVLQNDIEASNTGPTFQRTADSGICEAQHEFPTHSIPHTYSPCTGRHKHRCVCR